MFLINVILQIESVRRATPSLRRHGFLDKMVVKGFYGGGIYSIKDINQGFSKCDDVEFIRGDVLGDYIVLKHR